MKRNILFTLSLLSTITLAAQTETYQKPYFLPGDGMYLVGMPSTLKSVVSEPTIVTQAYQSRLKIYNTGLAAIKSGSVNYNISDRINEADNELNLVTFMGVGNAYDLTVRDFDGNAYHLGDNAPQKTWYNTRLLAAHPAWQGHNTFPLAVYDQWDCPISYDADPYLSAAKSDAVTVEFGNPHEGLVVKNVNFPLVVAPDNTAESELFVTLNIWNSTHTTIIDSYSTFVNLQKLTKVGNAGDNIIASAIATFDTQNIVINTPFDVTISGFAEEGTHAWLPRAIDNIGIYPTHTSYDNGQSDSRSDACINVEGYFNYIGTWGWWDGKYERGEVVSTEDLVQIYYDPTDKDWPGDYFQGEVTFPVECTFGANDIIIDQSPSWISNISYDESQWEEYGSVLITMKADALPADMQGRNGKVVLCTSDRASFYTIYIRQGMAWFDMDNNIDGIIDINDNEQKSSTDCSDISNHRVYNIGGQCLNAPRKGHPYVRNGKIFINL